MLDFRLRQKRRKVLSSNLTILALCILIAIITKEVWDVYQREQLARASLEQARVQQQSVEERKEFLESEIALLHNETGVESKLRERFGIAKPGEKVIMLIDAPATNTPSTNGISIWERIKNWFR